MGLLVNGIYGFSFGSAEYMVVLTVTFVFKISQK
jgi:hypothetical protein